MKRILNGTYPDKDCTIDITGIKPDMFEFMIALIQKQQCDFTAMLNMPEAQRTHYAQRMGYMKSKIVSHFTLKQALTDFDEELKMDLSRIEKIMEQIGGDIETPLTCEMGGEDGEG